MTSHEMVSLLKGSRDDQERLLAHLSEKIYSGEMLSDGEVPIFEAVKRILMKPESGPEIVSLSATVVAKSKVIA